MCRIIGRHAEAMSAFVAARAEFQELAHQTPPDPAGQTGVGRANFRIGVLQAESGDKAAAEESWATAVVDFEAAARQPNPPIHAAGLAAVLALQGKWAEAAAAGSKVVDASGRSCESLTELALLQWAAADESGYRTSCAELLSRLGDSATDREARGIILACGGRQRPDQRNSERFGNVPAVGNGRPQQSHSSGDAGCRDLAAGQIQQGTEILERVLPQLAAAEIDVPKAREQLRAVHVMAALALVCAYVQSDNQQALAVQLDSLRGLVAEYEKAVPRFDEEGPRWLLGLVLDLARRELDRLGDVPDSPRKPAAE